MKNRKRVLFAVLSLVLVAFIIWIFWSNKALELNDYTVNSSRLPKAFDGYRIAQISDLHNTNISKGNEKLLDLIRDASPDMIAITGDLIDSRNTEVDIALDFVQEAMKIAPCYYVTGNHEARVEEYSELKNGLESAGVIVLEDDSEKISLDGETITILGVNDPSFQTDYLLGDSKTVMHSNLSELCTEVDDFVVLLSHRPELFRVYADYNIDLILSGHAHGGQLRIPFIGGVAAPNQGLFPEYDSGIYIDGNTNMLVSRGIGNSIFPFRVNNRPEVILVELNYDE